MNRVPHAIKGVLNATASPATPTDLILFVTDRCNAHCGHCFYRYAIDASSRADDLDLGKIEKVAHSLREPLHSLILSGGEPFLRQDLAAICQVFGANTGVEMIFLPTNGWLVDSILAQVEQICRQNQARLYVQVSLDGLAETHDEIRGSRGAFERAISTARALGELQTRHRQLYVTMASTISQRNLGELETLAQFVHDELSLPHSFEVVRGAAFRELTMLDPELASPANPTASTCTPLTLDGLRMLYPRLEKIFRRYAHLAGDDHPFSTPLVYAYRLARFRHLLDVLGKRRPFRCPAGRSVGVIYPSGHVALCELTKPVGNLAEIGYDFHAIWTSKRAQAMRERLCRCFCTHGCFQPVAMMREPRVYSWLVQDFVRYMVGGR